MTDLVAFLRARLDEDATSAVYVHYDACASHPSETTGDSDPCDCGMPARVLAEVEAKRRIIDLVTDAEFDPDDPADRARRTDLLAVLGLLLHPYADHPDYLDRITELP